MACGISEMLNVNEVYQRQHSNPALYRNPSEGVVDCLHRNNLVKALYTAKEYDEENCRFDKYWNDRRMGRAPTIAETHGHFSFDYSDVDAATCLANNHEAMMFKNANRRNGSYSDRGRRWMALAMGTIIETIHHPDRS